MSRSYKKTPVIKDHDSAKFGKHCANRKVRRYKGKLNDGNSYRKVYCSYDIHDYIDYYPYSQWRKTASVHKMTEAKWFKYFRRK